MQKEISVIVPAHNEGACIEKNIQALEAFLSRNFSSHEIIISEDGSTDGTDRIARSLSARNANIIHLHSDRRLGKGKAISRAMLSSSGENLFLIDADFPTSLNNILRMASLLDRYDLVLGSRLKKGAYAKRSLTRTFLSMSYNSLARAFLRTGVRDHQCGVKAARGSILREIVPEMVSSGFSWDTELIARARKMDCRIAEVPITWEDRNKGRSKVSIPKEINRMGADMLKIWYRISFGGRD
jgi:glycosyltransferase involved in cell wall biosynthesis